jgi:hypothetical protein
MCQLVGWMLHLELGALDVVVTRREALVDYRRVFCHPESLRSQSSHRRPKTGRRQHAHLLHRPSWYTYAFLSGECHSLPSVDGRLTADKG